MDAEPSSRSDPVVERSHGGGPGHTCRDRGLTKLASRIDALYLSARVDLPTAIVEHPPRYEPPSSGSSRRSRCSSRPEGSTPRAGSSALPEPGAFLPTTPRGAHAPTEDLVHATQPHPAETSAAEPRGQVGRPPAPGLQPHPQGPDDVSQLVVRERGRLEG